jgi:hypothetical protein
MSAKKAPNPHSPACAAPPQPNWRRLAGPILVALAATAAAFWTIDPARGGPGVTCDEPYHVGYGKRLVTAWRKQGLGFFLPANIAANFGWEQDRPDAPPVHPPLGNWLLGWMNHWCEAPADHDNAAVISIVGPRLVPAMAFGLLVFLVGVATLRMAGPLAGTVAAAGVCLVPRVFGHAHLAALDMLTTFWFVAAILAAIEADVRGGRWWHYAIAGVVWGLAMLTRLSGVLVAPPVAVWMLWRLRHRAIVPVAIWGLAGVGTLLVGWPWLWLDPIGNMVQFLGTGTHRQSIKVFYAGAVWGDTPDHQAPWHYAPVMFAAALPLGLLVLGLLGLWSRTVGWDKQSAVPRQNAGQNTPGAVPPARGDAHSGGTALSLSHPTVSVAPAALRLSHPTSSPGYWLVIGSLGFVMILVSWPGRPIYDGVRLFLMVFPLWAVSVGIGAKWLVEHRVWSRWSYGARVGVVAVAVAAQGIGLILYHPCYLSHYSLLVGGLCGAERLGFEVTYWGDSVTEDLLQTVADRAGGQGVLFGPNLAPYQAPYVGFLSPAINRSQSWLVGCDANGSGVGNSARGSRYAVIYRRKANLGDLPEPLLTAPVIAERAILGVWVARVIESPLFKGAASAQTLPR